jgi:hypothetical protein
MRLRLEKKQTATYLSCVPLTALALLGCGKDKGDERAAGKPQDRTQSSNYRKARSVPTGPRDKSVKLREQQGKPIQWRVMEPPTETTVTIGNDVGWCPGSHRVPRISGVRQVDTANAVILTAYFAGRPPHPKPGMNSCAGVETRIFSVVHIRGGLDGRPLYDGSQSPPKKRWPR